MAAMLEIGRVGRAVHRHFDQGSRPCSGYLVGESEPSRHHELSISVGLLRRGGTGTACGALPIPPWSRSADCLCSRFERRRDRSARRRPSSGSGRVSEDSCHASPSLPIRQVSTIRRSIMRHGADGSQAAYVGSANLTFPGISGVNIEAGLVLDTADGDPEPTLAEIAFAVDTWFNGTRDGVHVVRTHDDVAELVAAGVLGLPRPTRPRRTASSTSVPEREPVRLDPLVRFPSLRLGGDGADGDSDSSAGVGTIAAPTDVTFPEARLSVPHPDVAPPYVLFAPDATDPTHGVEALTGSTLPGGAIGLIIRLNRDSSRHFEDRRGTANVSVPVPAIAPLRFGFYAGRHRRPRCEFTLRMRYVDDAGGHCEQVAATNVMVYGHAPGETGNSDVRLVIPRPAVRAIQDFVQGRGSRLPADGHPMVLESPTLSDPSFKASFADPDSQLFAILREALDSAAERGELVGRGACWLLPDLVTLPDWQSE